MTNSQAWNYAIGMIKVDGLVPTEEFKEQSEKSGYTDVKTWITFIHKDLHTAKHERVIE